MKLRYLTMMTAMNLILASCGDEVKDRRRVVYVDEEGKVIENAEANPNNTATPGTPTNGSGNNMGIPVQPPGTSLMGSITTLSALGLVTGWAVDAEELTESIEVSFYIGDDEGGTLIGQTQANLSGFDNSHEGNHRFEFPLPEAYRDGTQQKLYILMKAAAQQGPLTPKPETYTAYSPSVAGQNFYQSQILPTLNNCQGCHPNEVTYDNHFRLMLDKSPANGGTASNNRLILKAFGQLNHGGGNRCGGINNGACNQFQQWWNLEFGS